MTSTHRARQSRRSASLCTTFEHEHEHEPTDAGVPLHVAHPALHFSSRVVGPGALVPPPAWALGLSFAAALAKVVRLAREPERVDADRGLRADDRIRSWAEAVDDEKQAFWLREQDGADEDREDEDEEMAQPATKVLLEDLMRSARATRKGQSVSHHDFAVLKPAPGVVALEDSMRELEPHDPWEHVEWDADRGDEAAKPPSYAQIVEQSGTDLD